VLLAAVAVGAVLRCFTASPAAPVYLVDFAVHKGLDSWKFSKDLFIPMSDLTGVSYMYTIHARICMCAQLLVQIRPLPHPPHYILCLYPTHRCDL
jgi:hypothetical protein